MKALLLVLVVTANSVLNAQPSKEVYEPGDLEQSAEYPGGLTALYKYLKQNICYPESGKKDKLEGKVYVEFVIDKNGKATNPKIKKGLRSDFDTLCISAFEFMPAWAPGKLNGKNVCQRFTVPFIFSLKNNGDISFTPVSCVELQQKRTKLRAAKDKKKK